MQLSSDEKDRIKEQAFCIMNRMLAERLDWAVWCQTYGTVISCVLAAVEIEVMTEEE